MSERLISLLTSRCRPGCAPQEPQELARSGSGSGSGGANGRSNSSWRRSVSMARQSGARTGRTRAPANHRALGCRRASSASGAPEAQKSAQVLLVYTGREGRKSIRLLRCGRTGDDSPRLRVAQQRPISPTGGSQFGRRSSSERASWCSSGG